MIIHVSGKSEGSRCSRALLSTTAPHAPASRAEAAKRFPSKVSPLSAQKSWPGLIFLVSVETPLYLISPGPEIEIPPAPSMTSAMVMSGKLQLVMGAAASISRPGEAVLSRYAFSRMAKALAIASLSSKGLFSVPMIW